MMKKDVRITSKPHKTADQWVSSKPKEPIGEVKRVTVDLPVEIHQKLKIKCVMERVGIADMVRGWIEEKLKD
jgi:hypothetical protein